MTSYALVCTHIYFLCRYQSLKLWLPYLIVISGVREASWAAGWASPEGEKLSNTKSQRFPEPFRGMNKPQDPVLEMPSSVDFIFTRDLTVTTGTY